MEAEAPNQFEEALFSAERDCFDKVCEILGLTEGRNAFLSTNAGALDCVVFDIGYPETGDMMAFPSDVFHWRGQLDIYNRSRRQIQRWLMRLIAAMPIGTTQATREQMRDGSNVQNFRIMPTTNSITEIATTSLKFGAGDKGVEVYTSTIIFDIVFIAGSREG